MQKKYRTLLLFLLVIGVIYSCANASKSKSDTESEKATNRVYSHVDWSKNASIYEVNVRQYTPEGTFAAFAEHLPRLKNMGVDILWLMPIYPISEKNRKGSMGSYYAVQDYQKINPDLGTINDLKMLVDEAHKMGMKVILDWVANHTGWDNWLISAHPDWYTQDSAGQIIIPKDTDWSDVADLNYDSAELREYMIQSLEFWLNEANVDGYRCDVAGMVPTDFWVEARKRLDQIKPVFMLAEHESPEIHAAFDMTYGWELHHIMNQIAQGKETVAELDAYMSKIDTLYNSDDYIMNFTSNHDENTWNGTEFDRMGEAYKAMAVLSATLPGMPLIYSGQEDMLSKKLRFFDKDTIVWGEYKAEGFYRSLLALKHKHPALWNGNYGGTYERIHTSSDSCIFSFVRKYEKEKVIVILNLCDQKQTFLPKSGFIEGNYVSLFTQTNIVINNDSSLSLDPWGFQVLTMD